MIRPSFIGIIAFISILATPGQVYAELWKEKPAGPPKNLTDIQRTEWQIGNFAGWLRLCDYHSKASEISGFMKISPYFRKGVSQLVKYDMSTSCGGFDEDLKYILGQKKQWEQYLEFTYSAFKPLPQQPLYGIWIGSGQRKTGTCRVPGGIEDGNRSRQKLETFQVELMIREQEIEGRVTSAYLSARYLPERISVNASIHGTASKDGDFNLQFGESEVGAELVLQGKLPEVGNRASGKWNTPNCRGTLSLTRKSPY